jgi:hypothetical protein
MFERAGNEATCLIIVSFDPVNFADELKHSGAAFAEINGLDLLEARVSKFPRLGFLSFRAKTKTASRRELSYRLSRLACEPRSINEVLNLRFACEMPHEIGVSSGFAVMTLFLSVSP